MLPTKIISGTRMAVRLIALCGEQNWRCAYCGVRFVLSPRGHEHAPSFDEVVPRSAGGREVYDNQVAACIGCNSAKQSTDAYLFFDLVQSGSGAGFGRLQRARDAAAGMKISTTWKQGPRPTPSQERARLIRLRENAEEVPMTEGRAAYFRVVYGIVPGEGC